MVTARVPCLCKLLIIKKMIFRGVMDALGFVVIAFASPPNYSFEIQYVVFLGGCLVVMLCLSRLESAVVCATLTVCGMLCTLRASEHDCAGIRDKEHGGSQCSCCGAFIKEMK